MEDLGFLGTFLGNVWQGLRIGFHRFEAGFFELEPFVGKPDQSGEGDQGVQSRKNISKTRVECCSPIFYGNIVKTRVGDEIRVVDIVAKQSMDAAVWRNKTGVAVGAATQEGTAVFDGAENNMRHMLMRAAGTVVP